MWAVRGRETYVPLQHGKRAQARRGRASAGTEQGVSAAIFEGLVTGLLEFLFSWGRR